MLTTDYVPGSPCWLDLGVPDVPAALAFYGAVFGWEFADAGAAAGGYGFLRQDGYTVAGIGPRNGGEDRPSWTLYFATPDAKASAEAVERAGGSVRMPPMDVLGLGRMAAFADPQGAEFSVWQPDVLTGVDEVSIPGTLCWTELYTTDTVGAAEFYRAALGWGTEVTDLPGGRENYTVVFPGTRKNAGPEHACGGIMHLSAEELAPVGGPYWQPYFEVEECDAAVTRVLAHGGDLRTEPSDHESVGRMALCVDPAGALFAITTASEE
ncbi:VOC family protein [Streptomyces alkaliphilus]|uniref:VOC family protein n=1 Tax=Streptomyces alkaliphilus TaxID=1472722 RepID=UPI00117FFE72|nr:VOC family protein [Streptomyces alkaliphilus]MQS06251.1 VOC family protein [Streptomyces alkaliphilus]